jgi:hypothetical protein
MKVPTYPVSGRSRGLLESGVYGLEYVESVRRSAHSLHYGAMVFLTTSLDPQFVTSDFLLSGVRRASWANTKFTSAVSYRLSASARAGSL